MKITFQTPPKYLDEKMIFNVLKDYKILNCEVLVRDENGTSFHSLLHCHHRMQQNKQDTNQLPATIDDFIDVIMKDHRKYIRWLAPLSRSLSFPPPTRTKLIRTVSTSTTKSTASASTSWTSSLANPTRPS